MLDEKLEQASREVARKRFKFLLTIAGLFVFGGLVLVSVTQYQELRDLNRERLVQRDAEVRSAAVSPNEPLLIKSSPKIIAPKTPTSSPTSPVNPTSRVSQPATVSAPLSEDTAAERESFRVQLKLFETEIEPRVMAEEFRNWDAEIQQDIRFLKSSAISSLSGGDVSQAIEQIGKANDLALKALDKKENTFNREIKDARAAKNNDDYEVASKHISQALQLDPKSLVAKELQQEINLLPKILQLVAVAKVARAENKLNVEYAHLKGLLKLDSSREGVAERAAYLAKEIAERTFADHIKVGLAQIEKRNPKASLRSLVAARRIYPERDETSLLDTKVTNLQKELQSEALIKEAKAAAANDLWGRSLELFAQAKKVLPNNKLAIDGYMTAQSITALSSQISQHVNASHRLASANVAHIAHQLIKQAKDFSGLSRSLDLQTDKLQAVLASYAVDVAVLVVSDGQTRISVRGVGRVGVTTERVIHLKPGTYTFEGIRQGFKSKLLRIEIPLGTERFKIEIFCDERI